MSSSSTKSIRCISLPFLVSPLFLNPCNQVPVLNSFSLNHSKFFLVFWLSPGDVCILSLYLGWNWVAFTIAVETLCDLFLADSGSLTPSHLLKIHFNNTLFLEWHQQHGRVSYSLYLYPFELQLNGYSLTTRGNPHRATGRLRDTHNYTSEGGLIGPLGSSGDRWELPVLPWQPCARAWMFSSLAWMLIVPLCLESRNAPWGDCKRRWQQPLAYLRSLSQQWGSPLFPWGPKEWPWLNIPEEAHPLSTGQWDHKKQQQQSYALGQEPSQPACLSILLLSPESRNALQGNCRQKQWEPLAYLWSQWGIQLHPCSLMDRIPWGNPAHQTQSTYAPKFCAGWCKHP